MISDPIADMLTRIKNGFLVHKNQVKMPYSKIKEQIAKIMIRSGFLTKMENFSGEMVNGRKNPAKKELILTLKYKDKQSVITNIKRISKPGVHYYVGCKKLPRPTFGSGITIISTSKGLMTNAEAIKAKLGGELICKIW